MMLWGDTIGLAAFATIGAHVATTMGLHPLTACVSSMFSGTFGGFIRDVCCRQPPMVLTREVYAAAAFIGGAAYCATWACAQDAQLAILAALCSTGAPLASAPGVVRVKARRPALQYITVVAKGWDDSTRDCESCCDIEIACSFPPILVISTSLNRASTRPTPFNYSAFSHRRSF